MNLPNQAAPVERIISTATVSSENGDVANGIEASDWLDDVNRVVGTVGKIGGAVAPILGAFGI